MFHIHFDFGAEGDPPKVFIWDDVECVDVIEVFEEPEFVHDSGWSDDEDDWDPGPLALRVFYLLNEKEIT